MTKDKILTGIEQAKFKSMTHYWREVEKREDTSPLEQELYTITRLLGTDILLIIARYIELTEEDE